MAVTQLQDDLIGGQCGAHVASPAMALRAQAGMVHADADTMLRDPRDMIVSATRLAGFRVLEPSHVIMCPTAGLVLAALGVDVLKVEPNSRLSG